MFCCSLAVIWQLGIALTAVMLALGVATWIFSDIKFQADMGLLLTFMFLWNMFGAIVMIPALSALLLKETKMHTPISRDELLV